MLVRRHEGDGLDHLFRWIYDRLSPFYDRLWARVPLREQLVEMLALQKGDRVLETGVGSGINLAYIAERVGPSGFIAGIDISERMLELARAKAGGIPVTVELRAGNAVRLPYGDGSFDALLQFGGINFFSNRRAAIGEMVRVVRPGGRILIVDETIAPLGPVRVLLSRWACRALPRLCPPLDLLPAGAGKATLTYSPRGLFYIILLEKS
jgi:ubiquinone/menaquinone biosynthesis C-methylase UbiE